MARRLVEFLRWCARSGKDWRSVNYMDDLLTNWQTGLLVGTAGTTGKRLSNGTVNVYVSEAAYFLTWAAIRKYREPFTVDSMKRKSENGASNRVLQRRRCGHTNKVGSVGGDA